MPADDVLSCKCPSCRVKIPYRRYEIGCHARCSLCGCDFVLPDYSTWTYVLVGLFLLASALAVAYVASRQ